MLWGRVEDIEIREGDHPLAFTICGPDEQGRMGPLPCQDLLLFTPLNPEADSPYGVSLLRGLPFLTDILMKIYHTIGINWERCGSLRFAVTCRDGGNGQAEERSRMLAGEWSRAMQDTRSGSVRDFVAVGDVDIQVIGADAPVLDSEVPVRQILEQVVAKTGIPPFMLGLSWSSTERMSSQQADMLTTEITAIRRTITPVVERICRLWLRMHGYTCGFEVLWEDINLQDEVEDARAALYLEQARKLRLENDAAEAAARLEAEGLRPGVITVDPPRKGLAPEVIGSIAAMGPARVVYVSCDPATLGRDVKLFAGLGYQAVRACAVDMFPATRHVETVVLLSKGEVDSKKVRVEFSLEDMDMSGFQNDATYSQIKERVLQQTGLKVSSLYIAQIKQKHGIIERENYNKPKSENTRQPKCPPEKEAAITEALKYFGMI